MLNLLCVTFVMSLGVLLAIAVFVGLVYLCYNLGKIYTIAKKAYDKKMNKENEDTNEED